MPTPSASQIRNYVETHIGAFHSKRLQSLCGLRLSRILTRKNPYLFRAKNILVAQDFVKTVLDAHLSSQEETIFGEFLEGLARFVGEIVLAAKKSAAEGIDLEFTEDSALYLVAIKSGPNWGNSSQIRKMVADFKKAKKTLRTSGHRVKIEAINGCCYGKEHKETGEYLKICGQEFWELITKDSSFYMKIIEPIGHKTKEKNEEFLKSYAQIVNQFTKEFLQRFCAKGIIDWPAIVKFNSAKKQAQ